jgi:ABC-2 type transport system permease protein
MNKQSFSMSKFFYLSWYALKASLRNRSTVFFSLVFPLVFISAFGLIGNNNPTIKMGIPDSTDKNGVVQVVKNISSIKPQNGTDAELEDLLKKGKIDAILSQTGDKVTLETASANPTTAQTAKAVVKGIVDQANLQALKVTDLPIKLENKEVTGRQSRYIDFLLPGQIGFSLLSVALFGTVFGFIALRRLSVLKRMFATPTRPITILLSQGASRMVVALLQTTIILGVGVVLFHFYLPNGWLTFLELLFISALGLVAFMGFGLFLSGLADDENAAGPLVNLVTFPQMLLSGVFFGSDLLPSWMQPVANNLPLSYFNQAVRKITTDGGSFPDTFPYLVGFLAWGVVMYLLAIKTFKWE